MRLLAINPLWPHPGHSIRAANIVLFELLQELAQANGVHLGFLKLSHPEAPSATPEEREAIESLSRLGVTILPEYRLVAPSNTFRTWQQLLTPSLQQFYPELLHRGLAVRSAEAFQPDALFIPWSELATALFAAMPVRKYAYYGNPDHKSFLARAAFDRAHGGNLKNHVIRRILGYHLERMHLDVLRRFDVVGDVADNDARYYRRQGLTQASYIQNIWIDRFADAPPALDSKRCDGDGIARIIANVGKLGGTANTYGLEYLAKEVLPHLPEVMKGRPYEIHILGSGELHPDVARLLLPQSGVKMRGFVDDIDEEMARSGIFLCVNNATTYNVGHTRYLHAWSLGCCVVSHCAVGEAMPEIRHGVNALLGRNGREIAGLIAQSAEDWELRRTLGHNGYETFRSTFTARQVAARILAALAN